jgi:hypothetical protein
MLCAYRFGLSTPPPSRPDEKHHDQGDFIMAAGDPKCRVGPHLFLVLALCIPCLVVGCEGGDGGSKPVPVDTAQVKKVQEHFAGYREQMVEANKAKAKAKAEAKPDAKAEPKAEAKTSP